MEFNEALSNIGTSSADVRGIPKRVGGIVRRPVPAGYISDVRGSDEEDDDDTWKEFYKKQKRQDEGRRITRDDRPTFDHSDMRKFWQDDDDDDDDDVNELKELFMQLSGSFNDIVMSPHWKKGRQYDDPEDEDEDEDEEDVEEGVTTQPILGITTPSHPNYGKHALAPFWRKGKQYVEPEEDEDEEEEDEDE